MTTPDPADVHTGTDRVEPTDAEREALEDAINESLDTYANASFLIPAVESIVAARTTDLRCWKSEAIEVMEGLQELGKALGLPLGERITGPKAVEAVQELTAEVARMKDIYRCHELGRLEAEAERDAACAELAAANTRCAELEAGVCTRCGGKGWVPFHGGEIPCRTCEPDHPKAPRVEIEHIRDGRSTCKVYRDGVAVFYGINPEAEQTIAALQATLDRVGALAGKWKDMYGPTTAEPWFITQLRAALTPEGKP